ncbi:MAG TPA: bifunctional UDP-N-acetylglucosamine diphosphorylase/glucosamine-1-phosphate N-acetyltransferase GlmU [Geminicoccaceae bacterium]
MPAALSVTVLAAGKGTRMRNHLPKVLHPLAGRTLIGHVLEAARELGAIRTVVVLAPGMDEVAAEVRRSPLSPAVAVQEPQLGTGHALMAAAPELPREAGTVLVLYGDTPLVTTETLRRLVAAREDAGAAVAVLGMRPPDPKGYGRLRLAGGGDLDEIVEERHADEELKRHGISNSGVMALDAVRLPELLGAIPLRPDKNEYYLTDVVALAVARGWRCVAIEGPWEEGVGVNSQAQLADAMRLLQARLRARLLDAGVIMPAPETVYLATDTEVAPGAVIEPYCVFGPGVRIAAGAVVHAFSHLEGAVVGEGAGVGPFARLRPGSELGAGARVGNFVETKNARLAAGAKANHLTYLGDAEVGAGANIGAGTITCNYDGFAKHATRIGAGAFVGSNTALVAPVRVGDGAIVAAGSTVTADVPDEALAVARARQQNHAGHAPRLRDRLRRRKEGG